MQLIVKEGLGQGCAEETSQHQENSLRAEVATHGGGGGEEGQCQGCAMCRGNRSATGRNSLKMEVATQREIEARTKREA